MSEINYCEFAERLDYLRKSPSAFIEEVCGIKLNTWQKQIVENMSEFDPTPRRPMRRWNFYIDLCVAYSRMKDDDYIVIASPKKWDKLNKEQLAEYIDKYWK